MTYLVERLAELRRHLDHLRQLRPRVPAREALERDLSLRNDVLFSLLTVCQLVIDIAGELSARRGQRFEDYTQAVRNLSADPRFPTEIVRELERRRSDSGESESARGIAFEHQAAEHITAADYADQEGLPTPAFNDRKAAESRREHAIDRDSYRVLWRQRHDTTPHDVLDAFSP
jgi:hypothetical protein